MLLGPNGCGKSTLLKIKSFSLKTQKLNNKDIIGSGGYGVVYELKLDDSMALAIKRLNHRTTERDKGFERELEAMANIKHRNIVTLHGYYTAPHYNLLIYELMHVEDCELMGIMAIMVSALITANELKSKKRIFCLARRIEEAGKFEHRYCAVLPYLHFHHNGLLPL
ncbi:Receptor-like serine/threonine-protein kinase [Glycine soja]|uniref:Receptor-like serine/threonine-protein kinase n=1 Tax=Glycine soja TaxID=3848 RepID=A0A445KMD7_GLYSO|nr:Receptor-like serine/threonine-protein kinase [Glycine soja]